MGEGCGSRQEDRRRGSSQMNLMSGKRQISGGVGAAAAWPGEIAATKGQRVKERGKSNSSPIQVPSLTRAPPPRLFPGR